MDVDANSLESREVEKNKKDNRKVESPNQEPSKEKCIKNGLKLHENQRKPPSETPNFHNKNWKNLTDDTVTNQVVMNNDESSLSSSDSVLNNNLNPGVSRIKLFLERKKLQKQDNIRYSKPKVETVENDSIPEESSIQSSKTKQNSCSIPIQQSESSSAAVASVVSTSAQVSLENNPNSARIKLFEMINRSKHLWCGPSKEQFINTLKLHEDQPKRDALSFDNPSWNELSDSDFKINNPNNLPTEETRNHYSLKKNLNSCDSLSLSNFGKNQNSSSSSSSISSSNSANLVHMSQESDHVLLNSIESSLSIIRLGINQNNRLEPPDVCPIAVSNYATKYLKLRETSPESLENRDTCKENREVESQNLEFLENLNEEFEKNRIIQTSCEPSEKQSNESPPKFLHGQQIIKPPVDWNDLLRSYKHS